MIKPKIYRQICSCYKKHHFTHTEAIISNPISKKRLFLVPLLCTILSAFIILTGCAQFNSKPRLNPLQIEAMQTHTFDVSKRIAFNAVITILQNLGYIIQTANFDTGFITAQSPQNTDFFGTTSSTKTTAFITKRTEKTTKIRINFVANNTYSTQKGQPIVNDTPIENAQAYVNAFNKIRQQIFVSTGMDPVVSDTKKQQKKLVKYE